MKHAAAYIRRSSVSGDNPGDASREAQLAAVRRLCGDDVTVYADWGISGRKDDRPEYVKLKAAIEAGQVASVCAYSLSRLGRNARELLAFIELCQKADVPVRTSVESIDTSTAMGRAMLTVMAAFAQLEVEQGMERSAAARQARQARHDAAGVVMPGSNPAYGYMNVTTDGITTVVRDPDEPTEPIVDAFRKAGSVLGACRILRDSGLKAPRGGDDWATSLVTRILEREAPELLPARTTRGQRTPSRAMFSGLLRCPFCDRLLTPNTHRGQYYCANGPRDRARHPRYTVREVDVLPWIEAEADRLDIPAEAVVLEGIEARQDAITARLERAHELFIGGDIDRARYDIEKARANAELDGLAGQASMAAIAPVIDWDAPADVINAALRSMWSEVNLDEHLRPIVASWIVPEWRMADAAPVSA